MYAYMRLHDPSSILAIGGAYRSIPGFLMHPFIAISPFFLARLVVTQQISREQMRDSLRQITRQRSRRWGTESPSPEERDDRSQVGRSNSIRVPLYTLRRNALIPLQHNRSKSLTCRIVPLEP